MLRGRKILPSWRDDGSKDGFQSQNHNENITTLFTIHAQVRNHFSLWMSNNHYFFATFLTIYEELDGKFDLIVVLSLIERLNSSELQTWPTKTQISWLVHIIGNQWLRFGHTIVLNLLNMINGSYCGRGTWKWGK